ncbi:MAG: DNA cytosine methyltransferase [Pseudomonadota bacterium]
MTAWYNEIDPKAAAVLRELIKQGLIAPGVVDERSIEDVRPDELMGYSQCHFFAGFGVWSYALRKAGWSDDCPVWTASCPCQPYSAAGKGAGFDDERHLWPSLEWLISQCKPAKIYGEQVASKAAELWIDLVHADVEALGYAFGCIPFPAASVSAPHIRDRAYWVADAKLQQRQNRKSPICIGDTAQGRNQSSAEASGLRSDNRPNEINRFWADADWIGCRDGKWRPIESGTSALAHGTTSRVAALRGYGNAINAVQAQVFIESTM